MANISEISYLFVKKNNKKIKTGKNWYKNLWLKAQSFAEQFHLKFDLVVGGAAAAVHPRPRESGQGGATQQWGQVLHLFVEIFIGI